jgi:hypothetical protein
MADGLLAGGWRFHRSSFSGTGLALDGAGAALAGNLIGIASYVPLCACEHRGGTGEQASSDAVIPPVAGLPGKRGGLTGQERQRAASVSWTPSRLRCSSGVPNISSSRRICWLSVGCAMSTCCGCSRPAAPGSAG